MDAFMKDVVNVKPVLLKQNAPEMDAFQQRPFLILSVKPIFCWNLMPPKPMPFMSKMLSTLNLFCLTQCPQNGCLYERCSQCEASSFKAKCTPNGCLLWQLFLMRNLFLFHMMLPTWTLFCQRFCQHWILFVWHIAPEIDDGRCSQCQPRVLFVQVLEKTLWTLKTLLTETFCIQNARLPCATKAPANELVPCFLGCKIIFRASDFFTWLWLYNPTLQNHSKMQPQPGDMEPILDHLLGPIIDRFPKLFFLGNLSGPVTEH